MTAYEQILREFEKQRLRAMPGVPVNWRPEYDLALLDVLIGEKSMDDVVKASGYALKTCERRLHQLIPAVLSQDRLAALREAIASAVDRSEPA